MKVIGAKPITVFSHFFSPGLWVCITMIQNFTLIAYVKCFVLFFWKWCMMQTARVPGIIFPVSHSRLAWASKTRKPWKPDKKVFKNAESRKSDLLVSALDLKFTIELYNLLHHFCHVPRNVSSSMNYWSFPFFSWQVFHSSAFITDKWIVLVGQMTTVSKESRDFHWTIPLFLCSMHHPFLEMHLCTQLMTDVLWALMLSIWADGLLYFIIKNSKCRRWPKRWCKYFSRLWLHSP